MRWGLIGASRIAERVCASMRSIEGQELVGVYSRSAERGRDFAAAQGVAQSCTDLNALFTQARPEAVYISSTNELHAAQTLAALDAGCHVLCEKPLAINLDDAARMVRHAALRQRVLATNHHLRGSLAHQRLRELVAEGAIGRVHGVQLSHAVSLPRQLHGWRLNQPDAGGGVVLDILVHDVDLLRFVLGTEPQTIHTVAQHNGLTQAGLEDGAMSIVAFEGGVLAQLHESFVAAHTLTRLDLLGTEGTLNCMQSLTVSGTPVITLRDARGEHAIPVEQADLHAQTVRAFVSACAGHGAPLASGEDGLRSVAVALAGLASAASGCGQAISYPA